MEVFEVFLVAFEFFEEETLSCSAAFPFRFLLGRLFPGGGLLEVAWSVFFFPEAPDVGPLGVDFCFS